MSDPRSKLRTFFISQDGLGGHGDHYGGKYSIRTFPAASQMTMSTTSIRTRSTTGGNARTSSAAAFALLPLGEDSFKLAAIVRLFDLVTGVDI
jgi:hypothetical protein